MTEAERAQDPHHHRKREQRPKILQSVLQFVGETPCIRINKIGLGAGLECELVAKCEFYSAGGSVKDRIGLRMVQEAQDSGRIQPGDTLIEPTSGNTGIGLALASALMGYHAIITLPEKMSQEKVDVLKALGAEIIRTPTEAAHDSPESHIGVAAKLQRELPNAHILDQYKNPNNPLVHYDTTAEEIWESCEGKVDMIVCSTGTGGTLTGVARRLKELNPAITVVAVDPKGSILAEPEGLNDEKRLQGYQTEGIGYDFIPTVLDRGLVDKWVKTDDDASFAMSRRLIREEGLLCGGSSGSAMCGALEAARGLKAGQRCVVILPDGVRNYMSKFLRDSWMQSNGFAVDPTPSYGDPRGGGVTPWWAARTVSDLAFSHPCTASPTLSVKEAIALLNTLGIDQLPIVGEDNSILGVVTEGNLSARVLAAKTKPTDPVSSVLFKGFRKVAVSTPLSQLAKVFDSEPFAVVLQTQKVRSGSRGA